MGSAAGLGWALLLANPEDCPTDDLQCILERLGMVGSSAAVGAALGVYLAGRLADTEPSAAGAVIGTLVGTAGAVGLLTLLEQSGADPGGAALVVGYTVVHGMITAAGSRVGAALR